MKIETSRKFLDCTIIAYSFLRNGYNYCLANVFRKNGNRIQEWHSLQRNSDERRVWLVHASCIGFSPRLCNQAWKWSLRFTSKTSFLRWSMQTKWYDKSRNGVSFDRLACNRQKGGYSFEEAYDKMYERNYFGMSMVEQGDADAFITGLYTRSEERRVGKECRSRWSPYH